MIKFNLHSAELLMPIEFVKETQIKRDTKTKMASIFEIVDFLAEQEYTDDSHQVKAFVRDLTENPGSYIISNMTIFHALHKCGYLRTLISALRESSKFCGESPLIQKRLLKLKYEHDNISSVKDQLDCLCTMMEIMETVKTNNLRVSNSSLEFAKTNFGEFSDFIDLLEKHNVDFPVYNFTSEEKE